MLNTAAPDVKDKAKGQVVVDFTKIMDSDERGESRYVVGGRTYFEASIFGTNYNSFTYKGFFDQKGYTEPPSTLRKIKSSGLVWIIIGGVVALALLVFLIYRCCANKEQSRFNNKTKQE